MKNTIEATIFKEYFMKSFNKLETNTKRLFYTKIEILETNDYISKKLNMRENNIEFRCFRIGKFRFVYVLEDTRAIFLDVMYRERGYKHNYMDKLLEVYKHGN